MPKNILLLLGITFSTSTVFCSSGPSTIDVVLKTLINTPADLTEDQFRFLLTHDDELMERLFEMSIDKLIERTKPDRRFVFAEQEIIEIRLAQVAVSYIFFVIQLSELSRNLGWKLVEKDRNRIALDITVSQCAQSDLLRTLEREFLGWLNEGNNKYYGACVTCAWNGEVNQMQKKYWSYAEQNSRPIAHELLKKYIYFGTDKACAAWKLAKLLNIAFFLKPDSNVADEILDTAFRSTWTAIQKSRNFYEVSLLSFSRIPISPEKASLPTQKYMLALRKLMIADL